MKFSYFLFSVFLLFVPDFAYACNCPAAKRGERDLYQSDVELYKINKYQYIFLGKLTGIKTDDDGGITYTFEVQKQWKGRKLSEKTSLYATSLERVTLLTPCAVNLKYGKDHLIFADLSKSKKDALSYVSATYCSPSYELSLIKPEQLKLLDQVEKEGFEKVREMRKKENSTRPETK